jgi:dihydroxyacid dehydratase/phosphogluconate dehydratase
MVRGDNKGANVTAASGAKKPNYYNFIINIPNRELTLRVTDAELDQRRQAWQPPPKPPLKGYLRRYRLLVGSAARGAVLE